MNLDFSNPFFGFRKIIDICEWFHKQTYENQYLLMTFLKCTMYTICKRWLHFISESILAVFTFRKYLSSFLLGFPFHGMFWVILYAHEMCGGGWWLISYFDIRRFCLFRYLTFIYYFKFPVIITGPHFVSRSL